MDQVAIKNTLIAGILIVWGALELVWWWRGRKTAATADGSPSGPRTPDRWRNIFTFALIAVAVWWITTNGFSPT